MTCTDIDPHIIRDCKNKDKAAQKMLYEHYASHVYGICLRYAKNTQDAEDLMQDSFVKILKNITRYKDYGSFTGWLTRVAVNTAISFYRKKIRHMTSPDTDAVNKEADKPFFVDVHLFAEDIVTEIKSLPDGYRMVFNLYAIEGYDHNEIGEMLGIAASSSRSQYFRARKMLQKKLQSTYKEG
jgi:RNA polymerase sigma-70 factor (ECF subfamily)